MRENIFPRIFLISQSIRLWIYIHIVTADENIFWSSRERIEINETVTLKNKMISSLSAADSARACEFWGGTITLRLSLY